jgi:hypothetical protein
MKDTQSIKHFTFNLSPLKPSKLRYSKNVLTVESQLKKKEFNELKFLLEAEVFSPSCGPNLCRTIWARYFLEKMFGSWYSNNGKLKNIYLSASCAGEPQNAETEPYVCCNKVVVVCNSDEYRRLKNVYCNKLMYILVELQP